LVIGEIVSLTMKEEVLDRGRIRPDALDLISRMGGLQYGRTRERFEMHRPDAKFAAELSAKK
jgi:hypothetical protein